MWGSNECVGTFAIQGPPGKKKGEGERERSPVTKVECHKEKRKTKPKGQNQVSSEGKGRRKKHKKKSDNKWGPSRKSGHRVMGNTREDVLCFCDAAGKRGRITRPQPDLGDRDPNSCQKNQKVKKKRGDGTLRASRRSGVVAIKRPRELGGDENKDEKAAKGTVKVKENCKNIRTKEAEEKDGLYF